MRRCQYHDEGYTIPKSLIFTFKHEFYHWKQILLYVLLDFCCSVAQSCLIGSNSLWPHELQHPKLLCPSLSPGVFLNSCLFSRWYYLTISLSVSPSCSCLLSFPASRSLTMSWLFTLGVQNIGALVLASVLSMNIQSWFPLGLAGLISLQSSGLWWPHFINFQENVCQTAKFE